MRSACPPIMYSCKFLNFTSKGNEDDLLARRIIHELEGLQLDRVTDSDSVGRWFESSRAYQKKAKS